MANISELKALASVNFGFARSNNYLIELPSIGGVDGASSGSAQKRELNLLCKNATIPGKQILTLDRTIGMRNEKIAYGYAVADVGFTFYAMNDYFIHKYFDRWRELMLNEDNGLVGYKKPSGYGGYRSTGYAASIKIHQLRKPQIGINANVGPIQVNVGLGGGSVYSVELIDAFPTTINSVEFTNDLDGLVEVNVQMSYTDWKAIEPSQNFINVNVGV